MQQGGRVAMLGVKRGQEAMRCRAIAEDQRATYRVSILRDGVEASGVVAPGSRA